MAQRLAIFLVYITTTKNWISNHLSNILELKLNYTVIRQGHSAQKATQR